MRAVSILVHADPGDRVEIVSDMPVKASTPAKRAGLKDIENAKGMQGVVVHYEFDDGYEACQCVATSLPLTVLLDAD